jgi:protein-export membrane protein SecD|tara:strand:+ start:11859 stop:13412 length:1554 start_codon:yes stop_codon:yes gene_type:complete
VLYFSKLRIFLTYSFILCISFFALSNFIFEDKNLLSKKINLGLDLQGGSYLLLEIDNTPIILQKLQNKLIAIKNNFKENNIDYKNIKILNEQIIFEINKNSITKFEKIFLDKSNPINSYYDTFKSFEFEHTIIDQTVSISYSKYGLIELKNDSIDQALEIVRRRIDELGTNEPNILKRGNERILVELPGLDDPSRIKNLLGKTANLSFRFISQQSEENFGSEILKFENSDEEALVSKRIILSGDNLIDAKPRVDNQTSETIVSFSLDRLGAKRFAKATTRGVGRRLAIVLDGKIISAPIIRDSIVGGNGQISGNFTFQTATDLALLLRSGALPAPLTIIEERTVGPDLGQDSIKSGIISLIIGFSLVIIFMFIKYKIFGLIANFTLVINLFLLIGVLTIFEATLTLPGIAGIILTVGMAVDANVLIYERIKEELKIEKNILIAFDDGYKKSKTAILDANITTLISAFILFMMGSGPVKGFSITLGVGILTTLFSVYFLARQLTSFYVYKNKTNSTIL